MDTPQEQHDAHTIQTDSELDALLDEALDQATPPASPDLAQRIIDQTLPMLGGRPVLARIGPTALRIAAAAAIVVGAGVATMVMTRNQAPPTDTGYAIEQIESELKAIDQAIEPGNTLIDEQLDMLSLRVELVSTEDAWSEAGTDTSTLIDQAVTGFEVDQLSDDTAFIWTDGTAMF